MVNSASCLAGNRVVLFRLVKIMGCTAVDDEERFFCCCCERDTAVISKHLGSNIHRCVAPVRTRTVL